MQPIKVTRKVSDTYSESYTMLNTMVGSNGTVYAVCYLNHDQNETEWKKLQGQLYPIRKKNDFIVVEIYYLQVEQKRSAVLKTLPPK